MAKDFSRQPLKLISLNRTPDELLGDNQTKSRNTPRNASR